jgi:flagellar biosynthesis GTPase FlhF
MLNSPKKPPLVAFGVRADSSGKKPASTIKQGKGKETPPSQPKEQRVQFNVSKDGDSEEQADSEEERDEEEDVEREQEQDQQQEQEQEQDQERLLRESKERASRGPTQSLWEHSQVHVHMSNSQALPSPCSPNIFLSPFPPSLPPYHSLSPFNASSHPPTNPSQRNQNTIPRHIQEVMPRVQHSAPPPTGIEFSTSSGEKCSSQEHFFHTACINRALLFQLFR